MASYTLKNPSFFDAPFYLTTNPDIAATWVGDPFDHYLQFGAAELRAPSAWFDAAFYRSQYPDLQQLAGSELLVHYDAFGAAEGRVPNPVMENFDAQRYLRDNPDVKAYVDAHLADFNGSETNGAIAHFFIFGINEFRQIFDTAGQPIGLSVYPDNTTLSGIHDATNADVTFLPINTNLGSTDLLGSGVVVDGDAGTGNNPASPDTLRLTGDAAARTDFTNPANQLRGLDLNGDGKISANGVENNVSGAGIITAKNFEIIDAYARDPFDEGDRANNYSGNLRHDGTGFGGDGVSTDGNIVLGGIGADSIFGGDGNDFLTGGGVASTLRFPSLDPANGNGGFADFLSGNRNADFSFVEVSALDRTDGQQLRYDGGETSDNVDGTSNVDVDPVGSHNDRDWVLLEASDDDEPTRVTLSDSVIPSNAGPGDTGEGITTRSGNSRAWLAGIESVDASGNLYGFLNDVDVKLGFRAIDDRSTDPVPGTENYGIGSTAQLIVNGSNSANIVVSGYDNDTVNGSGGNDVLFGGNLDYLLRNQNNPNLLDANGGLDLNVNGANTVTDGRDILNGGNDNDAIVFETASGQVHGQGGFDTLYVTNESVGRLRGTTFDAAYSDTGAQGDALAALSPDQVLRIDLGNANGGQFRDYGGANRGLGVAPVENPTGDQTNYVSALGGKPASTVTTVDGLIATGLGDIDYKAAGSNSPELQFNNQQNYQASIARFDARGVNSDADSTTKFGNYWTDGNFGQDGANGALDNADQGVGSNQIAFRDIGDNLIYTSSANDTLEGRLGDDELGGGRGDDNFIFDFGDNTDIIRRQADANGDNLWDTDTAGNRLYAQDFRADPTGIAASRLVIDFGATDLTSPNVVVGNIFLTFNPGQADAFNVQAGDLSQQRSITAIAAATNAAFQAIDPALSVTASGNSLIVSDAKGRDISDTTPEGYAVFVAIGNSAASTTATLNPGGQVLQENDRVIFQDYLDRNNNSLVNDKTDELQNQAQDLVIGTGSTTTLANSQQWRIQLQNLAEGDKVAVNINGTIFSRSVQAGETTDDFVANFSNQINKATLDLYTAAGHVAAATADVNAGNANERVLILSQNAIGAGENKVYMSEPQVTITAVNGASSSASSAIANTSSTSIELYKFDGRDGNINADDVLFIGRSGQQTLATSDSTAILQFTKNAGETLTGKDASVVLIPRDNTGTVPASTRLGNNSQGATTPAAVASTTLYHAINGDDQLIGGNGADILNGGTGDDRFIGSKGTDTIDGGGNVVAPNGEKINFVDSILYQEGDFGAGSKFTITLDGGLDSVGKGVVTAVDAAGAPLGTTNFTNIEEIRTASNAAQDTIDYAVLSNNIATATGTSANLDKAALEAQLLPLAKNVDYNEGTLLRLTEAAAGFAFAVDRNGDDDTLDAGEISPSPVAVYGVENVIGGAANDVVVMDKTQAGSTNNISLAGEQPDLTPGPNTFTEGRDLVVYNHATLLDDVNGNGLWNKGENDNRPTLTVVAESASNTDTVSATSGAVGTAVVNDTLTGVEVLDIGAAATNKQALDTLDVSKIVGATVNFGAGAVTVGRSLGGQTTPNSVANVEANTLENGGISLTAGPLGNELLEILGITQLEKVTGSTGTDRVLIGDGSAFVNANFNLADTAFNDQKIGFNTYSLYTTATRTYNTDALVDNLKLYQFDLGAGDDSLDYRQSNDGVAVVVDFAGTVGDYVVVDQGGGASYFDNGTKDRIDLAMNVERYFGANNAIGGVNVNNVIDLSQATEATTVTFGAENKEAGNEVKDPNGIETNAAPAAAKTQDNQVTGINVSTATNSSVARFMEASKQGDGSAAISPNVDVLWGRVEGSNQNDTIKLSQYQDRLANETFNLRGGSNTVDYTSAVKVGQNDSYQLNVSSFNASAFLGKTTTHGGYTVGHASTDQPLGFGLDAISIDRQLDAKNVNTDGALTVIGSANGNDTVNIAALTTLTGLDNTDPAIAGGLDLTGADKGGATKSEEAFVTDIVGKLKGGYNLVDLGSGLGVTTGQVIQDFNLNFKGQNAIDDNVLTSIVNFENITGSPTNDRMLGNDSNNVINGGNGDDIFVGRGGGDTLNLGTGNDRVVYNGPGDTADVVAGDNKAHAGEFDTVTGFDNAGTDRIVLDLTAGGGFNLVNTQVQALATPASQTNPGLGAVVLFGKDDAVANNGALDMAQIVAGLGNAATLTTGVAAGTQMLFAVDTTDNVGLYLWTATVANDTTVQANELRLLAQLDDKDVAGGLLNTTVQTLADINAADFDIANGAVIVAQNNDFIAANTGVALDAAITKNFTANQPNGTQAIFAVETVANGTDQVSYFLWTSANADGVVDAAELAFIGTSGITADITAANAANVGAQALLFGSSAILNSADAADLFTGNDLAIRQPATSTGVADTVLFNDGVRNEIVYTALNQSPYGQIDTIGLYLNGALSNSFINGEDKIDLSSLGLGAADGLAVNGIVTRDRTGAGSQITDANATDFFYDINNVRRAVVVEFDNDDIDAGTAGTQARARVFVDLNSDGQLNTTQDLFIDFATDGTSTNAAGLSQVGFGNGHVPGYADFIFVV